jgi:hypothetical protein
MNSWGLRQLYDVSTEPLRGIDSINVAFIQMRSHLPMILLPVAVRPVRATFDSALALHTKHL